jgi:hypothetical protein
MVVASGVVLSCFMICMQALTFIFSDGRWSTLVCGPLSRAVATRGMVGKMWRTQTERRNRGVDVDGFLREILAAAALSKCIFDAILPLPLEYFSGRVEGLCQNVLSLSKSGLWGRNLLRKIVFT